MDLEKQFENVLRQVSVLDVEAELILRPEMLWAPGRLSTSSIRCSVAQHDYGSTQIRMIDLYATKSAIQALGLLIFSVLLSDKEKFCVVEFFDTQKREESSWRPRKYLVVEKPPPMEVVDCTIQSQITESTYLRQRVRKYPWISNLPLDLWQLPSLWDEELGDSTCSPPRFWANEAITGFGGIEGNVRMARLFLDLGHPDNDVLECCLEGEPGFRGVGPASAELRIHLPGSELWESRVCWSNR